MTESISSDQLKHRILGAVLLAILAVLVIPLLLGTPKDQLDLRSPEREAKSGGFQSKISQAPNMNPKGEIQGVAVPQKAPDTSSDTPPSTTSEVAITPPKTEAPKAGDADVANKPPAESSSAPADAPAAQQTGAVSPPASESSSVLTPVSQAEEASSDQDGWALQIGVFAKKSNATAIAASLKQHGFSPKLSDFKNARGNATRVWLGSFSNREAAEAASKLLNDKTGNKGYIKPLPFE